MSILLKVSSDSTTHVDQVGFGSCIENHVLIKEKIDIYNSEAMILPKLKDVWESKIHITIGKVTCYAFFDLGSSFL
jgi:hypothetical protein